MCVKQKYCPGRAIQTFRCMWNDEVCCLIDGPFETTKRTTKLITVSSTYAPPIVETSSIEIPEASIEIPEASVEIPELSARSEFPEQAPIKEDEINEVSDVEDIETTEASEDTTENDTETNEETSPESSNSISEPDKNSTTKKYNYKKKYPKKKV